MMKGQILLIKINLGKLKIMLVKVQNKKKRKNVWKTKVIKLELIVMKIQRILMKNQEMKRKEH